MTEIVRTMGAEVGTEVEAPEGHCLWLRCDGCTLADLAEDPEAARVANRAVEKLMDLGNSLDRDNLKAVTGASRHYVGGRDLLRESTAAMGAFFLKTRGKCIVSDKRCKEFEEI